jgi:hypothetical protein
MMIRSSPDIRSIQVDPTCPSEPFHPPELDLAIFEITAESLPFSSDSALLDLSVAL